MIKRFLNEDKMQGIFSAMNCEYTDMYALMSDTAKGVQEVSKKEAEDKIRSFMFQVLELDPADAKNAKLVRRALQKHRVDVFEVIEDVVEDMLTQGWQESEFFDQFVEQKNLADGDRNEFWAEDDVVLAVSKVAGEHHSFILQRLGEGQSQSIATSVYGAAVGTDIRLFLTGRKDWSELVNAIYRAFDKKIKDVVYESVINVGEKLPANSTFNVATALSTTTKSKVDNLIENVSAANGGASVVIMGVSSACRQLEKLTSVDWISEKMKDAKYESGRLGYYQGTPLLEIPQRLKRTGVKGTDEAIEAMIKKDILLVMPNVDNKFVKFVNVGDPEIIEVTEQGARNDDTMKFEYQQSFGVATMIGKYFGVIKITG